jgi:hypothetical protein
MTDNPFFAHAPLPWDLVPAADDHGPCVTTAFGTTVCDFYSVRIDMCGQTSVVEYTDADENAAAVVRAVNNYRALVAALRSCAEDFDTGPTTVMGSAVLLSREFRRRMALAADALSDAVEDR